MDFILDDFEVLKAYGMFVMLTGVFVAIMLVYDEERNRDIDRGPSMLRDVVRTAHMEAILQGGRDYTVAYLRMDIGPFMVLAQLMRNGGLLKDTIHVSIEEQLAMFLHIVGHKEKQRSMAIDFCRSRETVSRYFNRVLGAICAIRDHVMRQPGPETPCEIETNPLYNPFFKDCIGMLDGTHIDARLPRDLQPRFRGRKGVTQNVLAVCTPNKRFSYVLAGWEGSANDYIVLKDALSAPPPAGLKIIQGKYYLVDAGYTTQPGFISPYRGVRYHLKEQEGRTPNNRKELFNLRHSSLRSKIESAFGILKNRFCILGYAKPHHPFPTQVDIVLACCVLHNYILGVDPNDKFIVEAEVYEAGRFDEHEPPTQADDEPFLFSQGSTNRQRRDAQGVWLQKRESIAEAMWNDFCVKHRGGNLEETPYN